MKIPILFISISLLYSCGDNFTSYTPIKVPQAYTSPSGESGQILLSGPCNGVRFFHGSEDDEADWHWHIDIDDKMESDLLTAINNAGLDDTKLNNLDEMYAELMLVSSHDNPWFDEFFYSVDMDLPFMFTNGNDPHPFYALSLPEIEDDQGLPKTDLSAYSALFTNHAWIYLQGAFVNDDEHDLLPEIHPLDGLAFAMNEAGVPLSATIANPDQWPNKKVIWRVCFFANSDFHRINNESYIQKERTTTWYLDLPSDAYNTFAVSGVEVKENRRSLWLQEEDNFFTEWGVQSGPVWELANDPKDGKQKLKVTATMKIPDNTGGIVVTDYEVSVHFGPQDNVDFSRDRIPPVVR